MTVNMPEGKLTWCMQPEGFSRNLKQWEMIVGRFSSQRKIFYFTLHKAQSTDSRGCREGRCLRLHSFFLCEANWITIVTHWEIED